MELKTIERALLVFKCFAQGNTSLGTTELAKRLDTNKASMSRVLTTLKKHDFLERDPNTRRYRLGRAMVEMARAVNRSLDGTVVPAAIPHADTLRDAVGETVHLEVLSGNNIYLAYVALTRNPISLNIEIGDQVMPHAHAGSKAIVAFSPPDVIEHWMSQELIRYNSSTVTDRNLLHDTYEDIRKSGVAYDFGEYLKEVNAIGAPIFNHENKPVAGLLIVAPSYRVKKWGRRHISQLKAAANEISHRLHSSIKI